ncbi:coiled-coil domain-containing protein 102A-like isoform X2 [Lineus longissimus]|uniref:coiled-coil domain-containing protein 102A-like isoform X2 n=1 Tax=Lineus longissimus TaxID=88925 RepID=UPI00315D19E4
MLLLKEKFKMSQKQRSTSNQKSDVSYVGVTTKPHSQGAEGGSSHGAQTPTGSQTPLHMPTPLTYDPPSNFTTPSHSQAPTPVPSKHHAFHPHSSKGSLASSLASTPVPFGKGQGGAFTPTGGAPTPQQMEKVRTELQRLQMQLPPLDNEFEAKDELRQRELEEAKTRASQMEKTMRWWSDCTANWREKWSKVRNERNKSREECRQLRNKLENLVKELNSLQRDKHELKSQNDKLKKEVQLVQTGSADGQPGLTNGAGDRKSFAERDTDCLPEPDITNIRNDRPNDLDVLDRLFQGDPVLDTASASSLVSLRLSSKTDKDEKMKKRRSMEVPKHDRDASLSPSQETSELMDQKIAAVEMKLEEAQKTIQAERESKHKLRDSADQLEYNMIVLKEKYDDLKKSKQDVMAELAKLKDEHNDELSRVNQDLEDESCSRYSMDKTLADLRSELERLQAENAAEWGKRERIETEKLATERENKKLRNQIEELEGNLEKRQRLSVIESDMKVLELEMYEKNKELSDLKHSHSKLKKIHQEKSTELDHAKRRAEQYELEVKKLRARIEDLKRDLATAEDEVDTQTNNSRRLVRTTDELQEEVENLRTQLQHSQSRALAVSRTRSTDSDDSDPLSALEDASLNGVTPGE